MSYFPFFVHLDFESDEPTPFTEVKKVQLGFLDAKNVLNQVSYSDEKMWNSTGEWIRQFSRLGTIVPVGYNLRNLVWPSLVLNMARKSQEIKGLVMPLEKKWNPVDMIDLSQIIVQGGYSEFKPTIDQACAFFGIETKSPLDRLVALFRIFLSIS